MGKFYLHSVEGYVAAVKSKAALREMLSWICWAAAVKHTDIIDNNGDLHAYLYETINERNGCYIIIDGGEITVPMDSLPAIEADNYVADLQIFEKWAIV